MVSGYAYRSPQECETLRDASVRLEPNGVYTSWVVVDSDGNVWWPEGATLHQRSNDQVTSLDLPVLQIYALIADPTGGMWVGTDRGLGHIDGSNVRWISLGLESHTLYESPHALSIDTQGNVWTVTNIGLQMLPSDADVWQSVQDESGLYATAISAARDGGVWVSHGWDIWRFRVGEKPVMVSSPPGSIERCNALLQLVADTSNDVWGVAPGCDLLQYISATGEWVQHHRDERVDKVVLGANGVVYALGSSGVWMFDAEKWQRAIATDQPSYTETVAVDREGRIWLHQSYSGELLRYENGQATSFGQCCELYWLSAMTVDDQSRLWLGTGRSLSMYDGSSRREIASPLASIGEVVLGSDGRIWLAAYDGVTVYQP